MKATILLFAIFFVLSSCNDEETTLGDTDLLANDSWKLRSVYKIYKPERGSKESFREQVLSIRRDTLTFYADGNVNLSTEDKEDLVRGTWSLHEDTDVLTTTLGLPLRPFYGERATYYPVSRIAKITQEELVLQTDTSYHTLVNSEGEKDPYLIVTMKRFSH